MLSDKEILQKAFDKDDFDLCEFLKLESMSSLDYDNYLEELVNNKTYYIIIFSHEFAKAFWGRNFFEEVEFIPFYIFYENKKIFSETRLTCYIKKDKIDSTILEKLMAYKYENKDNYYCTEDGMYKPIINNWQYHLQKMVIEKEPLKYLERFLDVE